MSAIGAAPPQATTHRRPNLVIVALGALLAIVLTVALVTAPSISSRAGRPAISHPARAGAAAIALPRTARYIPQEKALSPQVAVATTSGVYSRQDKSFSPAP